MEKYLIVVDMQNDFVTGSLGTKEAEAIVGKVREKIFQHDGPVVFTMETHTKDYLSTQEGKNLPVEHCIKGTKGWEIVSGLQEFAQKENVKIFEKGTFGSKELAEYLAERKDTIERIEFIGLCTDICVISNALMIKAFLPEVPLYVDAECCAGVTPAKHTAALETMRSCQIIDIGRR